MARMAGDVQVKSAAGPNPTDGGGGGDQGGERERERNKAGKQASLVGVGGVACVGGREEEEEKPPLTEGKGREVAVRCPRKENRARKGSG